MDNSVIKEDITVDSQVENIMPAIESTKPKAQMKKRNMFKEKECKVLRFNNRDKTLDIMFDKYGIKLKTNLNGYDKDTVTVKYKSEVGKKDFEIKL